MMAPSLPTRAAKRVATVLTHLEPSPHTVAPNSTRAIQPQSTAAAAAAAAAASETFDAYDWEQHQNRVAKLPIPSLVDTCGRFLEFTSPLLSKEEAETTREAVRMFLHDPSQGPSLQAELERQDQHFGPESSYVQRFWDDMYLGGRYPCPVNSNPAVLFATDPFHRTQVSRAASLAYGVARWYSAMQRKGVEADFGGRNRDVPLCMKEYRQLFSCTRIPFSGSDELLLSPQSRHIVVFRGAEMYRLELVDGSGSLVPETKLRDAISAILAGKCKLPASVRRQSVFPVGGTKSVQIPLGCFTAMGRPQWAEWRNRIQQMSELNKLTLLEIDTAIFTLSLDSTQPRNASQAMEAMLHGCFFEADQKTCHMEPRWHDKSIHLVVFPDGSGGLNFEHSPFDGATIVRMMDEVHLMATHHPTGRAPIKNVDDIPAARLKQWTEWYPRELILDNNPQLQSGLKIASARLSALASSNTTRLLEFTHFGKQALKQLKCSPDGVLQAAFQVTFHRIHSKLGSGEGRKWHYASAYESCSTKKFFWGRTEAVRPVSDSSTAFVREFLQTLYAESNIRKSMDSEQRTLLRDMLRKSAENHTRMARLAAEGRGVDRHLFSLYCIARRRQATDPSFSVPPIFQSVAWERLNSTALSTSNVNAACLYSIGFGAVFPTGYGVGYCVRNDEIVVSVSSFTSAPQQEAGGFGGVAGDLSTNDNSVRTDSELFCRVLEETLLDIYHLWRDAD